MLQFITNATSVKDTVMQAVEAIDGGCRWVQIRMKDQSVDEVSAVLDQIGPVCQTKGVTLIVDDFVELAGRTDVKGVHLGQTDMPVDEARSILGSEKIIGLTVNNLSQVEAASATTADYYGVGPWRFTSTKAKLAPILGSDGVREIVSALKARHPEREIVVIGGITVTDVPDILATGADGVAVSGAISSASMPALITHEFIQCLNKYNKI